MGTFVVAALATEEEEEEEEEERKAQVSEAAVLGRPLPQWSSM
jgi:hypothetical protein